MQLKGICPVCEGELKANKDVQISEILSCPDCNSLLVVDYIEDHTINLKKAPQIEEDWGQ